MDLSEHEEDSIEKQRLMSPESPEPSEHTVNGDATALPEETQAPLEENEVTLQMEEEDGSENEEAVESNDEAQDPDNAETPVKSPKKAPKQRPKVLEEDASYKLFVAVILDRHAMSKVLASCVKDLKKKRSSVPFQLLTMVIYLSNLKVNPAIAPSTDLDVLESSSLIQDDQEDHLLPFASFSRFSRSKGPSVSFTRFSTLWEGLGANLSSLPSSSLSPLLRLLAELTAFNHRPLRFVASAALLALLRGLAADDHSRQTARRLRRSHRESLRKSSSSSSPSSPSSSSSSSSPSWEWVEQLYTGVVCHRIRDVWSPVRLLVTRAIGDLTRRWQQFRGDDWLKYLGVSLGDKDAAVREEALRQLWGL